MDFKEWLNENWKTKLALASVLGFGCSGSNCPKPPDQVIVSGVPESMEVFQDKYIVRSWHKHGLKWLAIMTPLRNETPSDNPSQDKYISNRIKQSFINVAKHIIFSKFLDKNYYKSGHVYYPIDREEEYIEKDGWRIYLISFNESSLPNLEKNR